MDSQLPSAGSIRQNLRLILQEQILPDIRKSSPHQIVSAQLPLSAAHGVSIRELPIPPLEESAAKIDYPNGLRWDDVGVHAIEFPVLCCVLAGEIDLRIGVTTEMLKRIPAPKHQCGAYIVSLSSPAYFVIPSRVPYPTGELLPWERAEAQQTPAHLFWVRVLPTGALCHTTQIYNGQQKAQYSLLINDEFLAPMMAILIAALHPLTTNEEIARGQLHILFLRLQQDLQHSMPLITDGLHSRFPARKPVQRNSAIAQLAAPEAESPVLEKACDYIQLHLHEPLTPEDVARHLHLKPAQLNRIFRRYLNFSVMRYVAQKRMETARLLLQSSELSMQEISRLVGYKHASHFSRCFQEYEGISPLKFRQLRGSHYGLQQH